jgi:hypothetical protein
MQDFLQKAENANRTMSLANIQWAMRMVHYCTPT